MRFFLQFPVDGSDQPITEDSHGFDMYLFAGNKECHGILIFPQSLNVGEGIGLGISEHGGVGKLFLGEDMNGLIPPAKNRGKAKNKTQNSTDDRPDRMGDNRIYGTGGAAGQKDQSHCQQPLRQVHIRPGGAVTVGDT